MASDATEKMVTPNPSLLKAIGVLNLFFGTLLFFCGILGLRAATHLAQIQAFPLEPEIAQQFYDIAKSNLIIELEVSEQKANKAGDKAMLKEARDSLKVKSRKVEDQVDLKTFNDDMRWLDVYLWLNVITAPVLNLLMLASGIGLIQLRCWARTLGLWVAALKIVRMVALEAFFLIAVLPHVSHASAELLSTDVGKAFLAKAIADQNARNPGVAAAPPKVDPAEFSQAMRYLGNAATIFWIAFGVTYPAIALVVLTRASSRTACEQAESEDADQEE